MKLKILDFLTHGGHQHEFFKTGHDFYCCGVSGEKHSWEDLNRPINENVKYVNFDDIRNETFDVIIYRSGISKNIIQSIKKMSSNFIGNIQTTTPYEIPDYIKNIVWNSRQVMNSYSKHFKFANNIYIPHGYDPEIWKNLNLEKNEKVLTIANSFKKRSSIMGYKNWKFVSDELKICDLYGENNDSVSENISSLNSIESMIYIYNKYSVYLNTTRHSAMPRTRAEAMFCGTPIVTTNNFGISEYLKNNFSCIFADNKFEMISACKKIINDKSLAKSLSFNVRNVATKNFHIKDYLSKWNNLLENL